MPASPAAILTRTTPQFAALSEVGVVAGFTGRVQGLDVNVDRADALTRLGASHVEARLSLGLGGRIFVTAEQVHGKQVTVIAGGDALSPRPDPAQGADGLVTNRRDVCLGIYVADCCAVFLVDPVRQVIGLLHSGRKGTELGIVGAALEAMGTVYGSRPEDVVVQLGPCIRPPWYEVDFAADIARQCRVAGIRCLVDDGICTAANPDRYYSYRREKGRTGRMLALLALA